MKSYNLSIAQNLRLNSLLFFLFILNCVALATDTTTHPGRLIPVENRKPSNLQKDSSSSTFIEIYRDNKDYVSMSLSLIAISISLSALITALLNFRRKSGVHIRSTYSISSSIDCEDPYVSEILLINEKDRPYTVLSIQLQIGSNVFIEIENFYDSPLILKGYETWKNKYGPIEFYAVSGKRYNFRSALNGKNHKKKIVLETTLGKYSTKPFTKQWSPIRQFFENYTTAPAKIVISKHEDDYIGGLCKYLVIFTFESGAKEKILIHKNDHTRSPFKDFKITEPMLESKEALETALTTRFKSDLNVKISKIEVLDLDASRLERFSQYDIVSKEIKPMSWIIYVIFGKIGTILHDRKLHKQNKKALRMPKK